MEIRHVIFFPGYAILWVLYMFPTEWGKARNTAGSSRRWASRDKLAPVVAILIYIAIIGIVLFVRSPAWDVLKSVWSDTPGK